MLRLWLKVGRKWEEVPNGPFPVTQTQMLEMRSKFRAEWDAAPMTGAKAAPHTTACDIVRQTLPNMAQFDASMVAYAVAFDGSIRTQLEVG